MSETNRSATKAAFIEYAKFGAKIVIVIIALAIGWATVCGAVKQNTVDIGKHDKRISTCERKQNEVNCDIRAIKTDISWIRAKLMED